MRSVDCLYVLGRLHELSDLAVNDVLGGSELDVITNGCKKGDVVDG